MEQVIDNAQILIAENDTRIISTQTDDDALVRAVLAGDEAAFELLFERYKRLTAHLAGRFFYNRAEVEEIVQQSFTKIYFSLGSYQGGNGKSFSAWLSKITINQCYDELRRRKRRPENLFGDLTDDENAILERAVSNLKDADNAENSLINRDLAEKLLSKLEASDRLALTLIYAEEMSVGEVAELVGWSQSNVKTRLFRARNYLRKAFKIS